MAEQMWKTTSALWGVSPETSPDAANIRVYVDRGDLWTERSERALEALPDSRIALSPRIDGRCIIHRQRQRRVTTPSTSPFNSTTETRRFIGAETSLGTAAARFKVGFLQADSTGGTCLRGATVVTIHFLWGLNRRGWTV